MTSLLAIFLSASVFAQSATVKPFKDIKCPGPDLIAKSYLELETNGYRVGPKCVDTKAYPFLHLSNPPRGSLEGVPSKSEIAVEAKPFTIDKVEKSDSMHYKVSFHYHVQQGLKIKDVGDVLYFDVLQGAAKDRMGCALESGPPKTLAIRANCDR